MIPKKIHYIWLSNSEKPAGILRCLQSWKEKLPGYEIVEWNESNLPIADFPFTKEAYEAKKWAFVSDFFRLWVLLNNGGIYLDTDVMVHSSFDPFLKHKLFLGTEFTDQISTHIIGCEKDHPFIRACLEYYKDRHFRIGDSIDMTPNSCIMTKIFMTKYNYRDELVRFDGTPNVFEDLVIYPDSYFMINTYDGNNVCVHEQNGSWRNAGAKNPILEEVMESYFWKKFCRKTIFSFGFLKKWVYLLLPMWAVVLYSKHSAKIVNNKRAAKVKWHE
ncbi:glycosyltransferase family 32 protein [Fibrobacter sp.]|uniref:glycosyltransferase family 32 protein n=1 Tax=Fibrobacter sp. TaxID=35828 RepID=UPI003866E609